MCKNYGFDEHEGFVGEVQNFNGLIFYLREANTNSERPNEFWFQRIVTDWEAYYEELKERGEATNKIAINKKIATKFKNEFERIIKQLNLKKKLINCAFCNVNANGGGSEVKKPYKEALKNAHNKMERIINCIPSQEVTIITCRDIYAKLKASWKEMNMEIYNTGIKYDNGDKEYFFCQIGSKRVFVYEMYHPSRRRIKLLDI